MIRLEDLNEAIAECNGERNPNANTCIKLAAFYTLKEHLFGAEDKRREEPDAINTGYSFAAPEPVTEKEPTIIYDGKSEFAEAIYGKKQDDVFPVLEEMMDTLRVIFPKLYNTVMRKL